MRDLTYLLRRTLFASFDDGLFTIAKGAAYSALLSFFPIMATVATVLLHARADFVRRSVVSFLAEILPPGTDEVVLQQFRYEGKRPNTLLIVAIVLSLWAASSVIKSLIDGFNAAYRVPRNRSIMAHAVIGLMLALLEIVPLLGASSLIIFGGTVETAVIRMIKVDPILNPFAGWWEVFFRAIRYAIAFAATATLTAILYFYGPYRKQRWRGVWPGAILATSSVVDRNPWIWLVRGPYGEVQRALWQRGNRNRAADLDVRAGGDRAFRLRIQRGIRTDESGDHASRDPRRLTCVRSGRSRRRGRGGTARA